MGDDLPYVDLGEGETVRQLSMGEFSACVLLDSGKIKCWGDNEWGQLGIGDRDGHGDNGGEMGTALPAVDLGPDFEPVQISVGHYHACALSAQHRVKCWGFNEDGQLGLGDYQHRGDDPDEMGSNLPYVDLGSPLPVVKIVTGGYHSCAILSDGQIKCWGRNWNGHLGQGNVESLGDSSSEMGASLPSVPLGTDQPVIDAVAGHDHTCVQFGDGDIKCWGDNQYGDLALGDTNNRGDAGGEMGTDLPFLEFSP